MRENNSLYPDGGQGALNIEWEPTLHNTPPAPLMLVERVFAVRQSFLETQFGSKDSVILVGMD